MRNTPDNITNCHDAAASLVNNENTRRDTASCVLRHGMPCRYELVQI